MTGKDRFTKHMARLHGFATALTGDAALAEDLVQEAYLKALRAKQMPLEEAAIRAWMFKILRHSFIDYLRRQKRFETFFSEETVDEASIDDCELWAAADRAINLLTIRQAFEGLSGAQREIIGLIDLSGFSYAEAAEILEVPIGTVSARRSLRSRVTEPSVADTCTSFSSVTAYCRK